MKGDHSLAALHRQDEWRWHDAIGSTPLLCPSDRAFKTIVAPEQFTVRCRETRRAKDAELLGLSRLHAQRGFVRFRSRGF